jgi:hypothetical protein
MKNESMKEYIARVTNFFDKLHDIKQDMSESMKKYYLRRGIEKINEWKNICDVMRLQDKNDTMTITDVESILISEDNSRSLLFSSSKSNSNPNNNNDNGSYYSNNNNNNKHNHHKKPNMKCGICKMDNHTTEKCYKNPKNRGGYEKKFSENTNKNENRSSGERKCYVCGSASHVARNCFKRADKPQNGYRKNENDRDTSNLASSSSHHHHHRNSDMSHSSSYNNDDDCSFPVTESCMWNDVVCEGETWILDSGASRHYTHNKNRMFNLRKVESHEMNRVTTANGYASFEYVGDVCVLLNGAKVTLKNVAYMPSFKANLLSVGVMTAKGAIVTFEEKQAKITAENGKVICLPRVGNLYMNVGDKAMSVGNEENVTTHITKIKIIA